MAAAEKDDERMRRAWAEHPRGVAMGHDGFCGHRFKNGLWLDAPPPQDETDGHGGGSCVWVRDWPRLDILIYAAANLHFCWHCKPFHFE